MPLNEEALRFLDAVKWYAVCWAVSRYTPDGEPPDEIDDLVGDVYLLAESVRKSLQSIGTEEAKAMSNLLVFPGSTEGQLPANVMLEKAKDADLVSVVIVGRQPDGDLFLSGSSSHAPDVAILLDLAKRRLLDLIDPVVIP